MKKFVIIGIILGLMGISSASVLRILAVGDTSHHDYQSAWSLHLNDGTLVNFPASANDRMDFIVTDSPHDLEGVNRLEFILSAPPKQYFEAIMGASSYSISVGLNFTSSNENLVISNVETHLFGASRNSPFSSRNRFSNPISSNGGFELSEQSDLFNGKISFDGLKITADIESPVPDGYLTVNSIRLSLNSRALIGGADPGVALSVVPEPSTALLSVSFFLSVLLRRRR